MAMSAWWATASTTRPALAKATIGFAMGAAGSDTALETADVALMDDDLRKLPAFIRLSRRTVAILRQNIALALGIKAVFLVLALTGQRHPVDGRVRRYGRQPAGRVQRPALVARQESDSLICIKYRTK